MTPVELRIKMLAFAAQVAEGTGEDGNVTIERAKLFARWIHTGGWQKYNNDQYLSIYVMEDWTAPMQFDKETKL